MCYIYTYTVCVTYINIRILYIIYIYTCICIYILQYIWFDGFTHIFILNPVTGMTCPTDFLVALRYSLLDDALAESGGGVRRG